jgi:hypothetical protein
MVKMSETVDNIFTEDIELMSTLAIPTTFTLQLLHYSDSEAGFLAPQTAPYLAALVDGFDNLYANTLILAGGDN